MPKSKKGRTADKYIDDLMSELNAQDDGQAFDGQAFDGNAFDGADAVDVPHEKESRDLEPEALASAPGGDNDATTPNSSGAPEGLNFGSPAPKGRGFSDESVTVPLNSNNRNKQSAGQTSSQSDSSSSQSENPYSERTQPMVKGHGHSREPSVKMSFGGGRSAGRNPASSAGQQSEGQLVQAENLKLAQVRILELETEMERLRQENELLASAGSIAKQRLDELMEKVNLIERYKNDALEQSDLEMKILRESLQDKDREMIKAKKRIEEMDGRLNTDLKKVRVRERELENRLELARMEKTALVRTKDENILDLKRKLDILSGELDTHRQRSSELQGKIDGQQDQLGRTVRALRLALTNLESTDSTSGQLVPIKKAE